MEMNNSRPSLNAYPMPPSTLYLPGLAALLNPLKFKNSSIYEVSTVSPVSIVPPKSIVTPTSTVSSISCNQSSTLSTPTLSGTRTVRCRNCLGCQSPPCGKCGYCKDSLQFGGPGVKKQTCIERKCVALIESRIQKDPTPVKNRPVCNNCEGCKQPDCQNCLVCYDKKFLDGKYLNGAVCSKKKCTGNLNIEETLKELKKFQQKECGQTTRPTKRAWKKKLQNGNAELQKPPPKPKRIYRRKPRNPTVPALSPPPPIEKTSEVEIVTIEEDNDLSNQILQQPQNCIIPESQQLSTNPILSPISNATQSPTKIQRYNPEQYLIPVSLPPIEQQNYYSSWIDGTNNQNFQIRNPWTSNVTQNSFKNNQTPSFPESPKNRPMRLFCRRYQYLRFPNRVDFNFSTNSSPEKFDPFIPPSYSGNEEVILQAL